VSIGAEIASRAESSIVAKHRAETAFSFLPNLICICYYGDPRVSYSQEGCK